MPIKPLDSPVRLFWDIDGTLLLTHGAAAIPFAKAVSKYAGKVIEIDRKKMSGYTDYEIVKVLLNSVAIEVSFSEITQILSVYTKELPASLQGSSTGAVGNIKEIMTKIKNTQKFELAIGTGNIYAGAKIKLSHVGLWDFFEEKHVFCATEDRWSRDLVIKGAKQSLIRNQVGIVIGDSPKDIVSAKKAGLAVISVATGSHSLVELSELNPDCLLNREWTYEDLINSINKILET
jgi:phosphoglycolate phosphatase-like HAD superfamily hydrolase